MDQRQSAFAQPHPCCQILTLFITKMLHFTNPKLNDTVHNYNTAITAISLFSSNCWGPLGGGYFPSLSYTKICAVQKCMAFWLFWSENAYGFEQFWSEGLKIGVDFPETGKDSKDQLFKWVKTMNFERPSLKNGPGCGEPSCTPQDTGPSIYSSVKSKTHALLGVSSPLQAVYESTTLLLHSITAVTF